MDSLIAAAARALAAGDALAALKRIALRDDPPALALRGIAMAQLGEYPRSRRLLQRAARGFGIHEELARARCVVAPRLCSPATRRSGAPSIASRERCRIVQLIFTRVLSVASGLRLGRGAEVYE